MRAPKSNNVVKIGDSSMPAEFFRANKRSSSRDRGSKSKKKHKHASRSKRVKDSEDRDYRKKRRKPQNKDRERHKAKRKKEAKSDRTSVDEVRAGDVRQTGAKAWLATFKF